MYRCLHLSVESKSTTFRACIRRTTTILTYCNSSIFISNNQYRKPQDWSHKALLYRQISGVFQQWNKRITIKVASVFPHCAVVWTFNWCNARCRYSAFNRAVYCTRGQTIRRQQQQQQLLLQRQRTEARARAVRACGASAWSSTAASKRSTWKSLRYEKTHKPQNHVVKLFKYGIIRLDSMRQLKILAHRMSITGTRNQRGKAVFTLVSQLTTSYKISIKFLPETDNVIKLKRHSYN